MFFGKTNHGGSARHLYAQLVRNGSTGAFVNQHDGLPLGLCLSQANAVGFALIQAEHIWRRRWYFFAPNTDVFTFNRLGYFFFTACTGSRQYFLQH